MIVTGPEVAAFVEQKISRRLYPPVTQIGLSMDGKVVAGAIFNNFEPGEDIELTIAAEHGAINRKFLRAMGRYVRDQLHCYRVSMTTDQPQVVAMALRLGGQIEGIKEVGPNRFRFLLGILKRNWKF